MARKLLVICNKRHERIRARRAVRIIERLVHREGIEHELLYTTRMDQIVRAARQAHSRGFTEIVCVGGDGTLNLIANEIVGTPIVLSVIPGGTGNILAKYLRTPWSIRRAFGLVERETPVLELDCIGRGSRLSLLNVSAGVSSLTMTYVDNRLKRVLGIGAYGLQLLKHLILRAPTEFMLNFDGTPVRARAHEVIVCNIGFVNTPLARLFQHSEPEDGRLECYAFHFNGVRSVRALLHDLLTGTARLAHHYQQRWEFRESFRLASEPSLPVQSDGDRIGEGSMELTVRSSALRVRSAER